MSDPTPNPSATAEPGAKDDAAKKKPSNKRVAHPAVGSEDKAVYPFDGTPPDFDHDKHKPLKKTDFKNDWQYYEFRAEAHEVAAAKFRKEAQDVKAAGGTKAKTQLNRLRKMAEKAQEIRDMLAAQGMDVEKALADIMGAKPEEAKK